MVHTSQLFVLHSHTYIPSPLLLPVRFRHMHLSASCIRFGRCSSKRCSHSFMHELFPKAVLFLFYSSSHAYTYIYIYVYGRKQQSCVFTVVRPSCFIRQIYFFHLTFQTLSALFAVATKDGNTQSYTSPVVICPVPFPKSSTQRNYGSCHPIGSSS